MPSPKVKKARRNPKPTAVNAGASPLGGSRNLSTTPKPATVSKARKVAVTLNRDRLELASSQASKQSRTASRPRAYPAKRDDDRSPLDDLDTEEPTPIVSYPERSYIWAREKEFTAHDKEVQDMEERSQPVPPLKKSKLVRVPEPAQEPMPVKDLPEPTPMEIFDRINDPLGGSIQREQCAARLRAAYEKVYVHVNLLETEVHQLIAHAARLDAAFAFSEGTSDKFAAVTALTKLIKQQLGNHAFTMGVVTHCYRNTSCGASLRLCLLSTQSLFAGIVTTALFRPDSGLARDPTFLRAFALPDSIGDRNLFEMLGAWETKLGELSGQLHTALSLLPEICEAGAADNHQQAAQAAGGKPWVYGLNWNTPPSRLGVIM